MKIHIKNKKRARELMKRAFKACERDSKILTLNFDLQKVLTTPKTEISNMYYSSKLNIYNLTLYDMYNHTGICNLWNETIAHRGSNEMCSILMKCIEEKIESHPELKEILSFSDNCSGQFKNKQMFTLFCYLAIRYNIKITHR